MRCLLCTAWAWTVVLTVGVVLGSMFIVDHWLECRRAVRRGLTDKSGRLGWAYADTVVLA